MTTDHTYRREIVKVGKMLHQRRYIAATDGNLSVRLDEDRVLVTPTGMSKGAMKTADMVIVDMDGRQIKGRRTVTSEIGMHLLIYRMRPDVRRCGARAPANCDWVCRSWNCIESTVSVRGRDRARVKFLLRRMALQAPRTGGNLAAAYSRLRCHSYGESWCCDLRLRSDVRIYEDGNRRALCRNHAGHAHVGSATAARLHEPGKIGGSAQPLPGRKFRCADAGVLRKYRSFVHAHANFHPQ